MKAQGHNLSTITEHAKNLTQIRKVDLKYGDWLFVKTKNSTYSIQVDVDGHYLVSGCWFDRNGLSPLRTTINGCTWGGSIIKLDIVAARGLCLEFGNHVVTTPIKTVWIIHRVCNN